MLWPRTMRELWSLDPGQEMRRIQREVNRLFSGFIPSVARRVFPAVNVWTGRDDAVVTAEIPGIKPDDLEISVVGDTLILSGSRPPAELKEGETYNRQERETGTFTRKIQLPFRVEPDQVEASYSKGVLRIDLPRLEADKPKQIAVKASN